MHNEKQLFLIREWRVDLRARGGDSLKNALSWYLQGSVEIQHSYIKGIIILPTFYLPINSNLQM